MLLETSPSIDLKGILIPEKYLRLIMSIIIISSHNNHCDHRNKIRLINKNQINRVIKQRPFKVE